MRKFAVLVADTGTGFEVIGEPTDRPEDLKQLLRKMVDDHEKAQVEHDETGTTKRRKKALESKYVEAAVIHSTKGMLSRRRF